MHNMPQMAPNTHSATRIVCTIFSTLFAHTHISALFDTPMHAKRINVHHNIHSLYTIRSTIGHNMECTTYVHLCILFSTLCAQYHTIHPFCTRTNCAHFKCNTQHMYYIQYTIGHGAYVHQCCYDTIAHRIHGPRASAQEARYQTKTDCICSPGVNKDGQYLYSGPQWTD